MIESVKIVNYLGESVEIELRSPEKSGFFIIDIDGLGPPKATINTNNVVGTDGSSFNSVRAEERNIVFRLGFHGVPGSLTIEDARQKSYKFFPIKSRVSIHVQTTNRTLYTTGWVESNEPIIFSKQQNTTISVICPDPFLYDALNTTRVTTVGIPLGTFEFPFEDVLSQSPTLEFGSDIVGGSQEVEIFNPGDVAVGFVIEAYAALTLAAPYFEKYVNGEWVGMQFVSIENFISGGISAGDTVYISTLKGDKYAHIIREGVEYNVLSSLLDYSDLVWLQLDPGYNKFRFGATLGFDDVELKFSFQPKFEGV